MAWPNVAPFIPPDQILADFSVCESSDLEQAVLCGERMFCKNRLEKKGADFKARFFHRSAGEAGVARMSFGGEVAINPGKLDDIVLVQSVLTGHEHVISDQLRLTCNPGHGTVFNYHQHTFFNHFPGTDKLLVRIDRTLLETMLQRQLGRSIKQDIYFQPHLPTDTLAGQNWLQTLGWAYSQLSSKSLLSSYLERQIGEVLASSLLEFHESNHSQALRESAEKKVVPAVVRMIEEFMEEHAQEPLTISQIATHAGVTARTVQLSFQRCRGLSPMQWLKEIRLQRVRVELEAKQLFGGGGVVHGIEMGIYSSRSIFR
ncbi:helix-turn-helix domain-containing protein [Pseudomonas plecoglossicida]|uniref:AraC-like ligand-binding domain-containing protein n=1 Tax=Pseudomonas plecoglossicida TaxID=70775 RepID=UPI00068CD926|nr:helix-turn-helix domain-containing protein [Pseudomonas plecoglossicida]